MIKMATWPALADGHKYILKVISKFQELIDRF